MINKNCDEMDFEEFCRWAIFYVTDEFLNKGLSGLTGAVRFVVMQGSANKNFGGHRNTAEIKRLRDLLEEAQGVFDSESRRLSRENVAILGRIRHELKPQTIVERPRAAQSRPSAPKRRSRA